MSVLFTFFYASIWAHEFSHAILNNWNVYYIGVWSPANILANNPHDCWYISYDEDFKGCEILKEGSDEQVAQHGLGALGITLLKPSKTHNLDEFVPYLVSFFIIGLGFFLCIENSILAIDEHFNKKQDEAEEQ